MSTSDDIRRVNAKMRDRADKIMRAVALEASRRIVMRTPVDTGRARGNWHASIGSPDLTVDMGKMDPGGGATIAVHQVVVANTRYGDAFYIVNGVPYIRRLEFGSSRQAPAGMVGITARELRGVVAQV